MASNTPNLSLYIKDPVADGNDFFDVKTMMNDNWEKIDGFAGGMDEVKERLNTISRQDVTLQPGVQIINAAKSALFQLSGLTGRMLVNLLGRMGNCESVGLWSSNTTIATDTANKTSGTSSFKLTLGSVPATASASFLTTPGKKYVAIADVKNGNTSKIAISINGIAGAAGNEVTSASAFAPSVVRFAATDYFHILTITGTGAAGNTFNMDSVRVYEISEADYAAAASYIPAQAAAKWPYVDSVMPVRNPYAIRYGENLLPSFYEWSAKQGTPIIVNEKSVSVTVDNKIVHTISPLVPGQKYTVSVQSGGATGRITVTDEPESSIIVEAAGAGVLSATFTATSRAANIRLLGTSSTSVTMSNPMLNIGSTAKPFKPREDSMLALQTDLYADPVTGVNADTVFERDGQYFKSKKWRDMTLDGNLAWALGEGSPASGNKQVKVSGLAVGAVAGSGIGTKYDGKLLLQGSTGSSTDTNAVTAAGEIYLGIPAVDSGWADGFTPTQDEIKAYFLGWNMYYWNGTSAELYNNQGPKSWRKINNHGATTSVLPTTQIDPGLSKDGRAVYWEPYRLVYQLATPTVEPIISEGQLTFTEGDNQVEVGTGIVVREAVKPHLDANSKTYSVNAEGYPGTLKYRPKSYLANYKGGRTFSGWVINATVLQGNGPWLQAGQDGFDAEGVYNTTYFMLNPSPVVPFTGSYAANEKTLLADLVDSVQQANTRLSVVENKKGDKDNPAWLTPILLNAWINYGVNDDTAGFLKDSQGYVHIKGTIKLGALNVPVFTLPVGYRPKATLRFTINATNKFGAMRIGADGAVIMETGVDGTYVSLQIPPFLAEQ
ncbi:hypothetical protein UY416_09840 [Paenibacillus polymyxa]|nr:hypothetical protein [Paenibacillus polymyxa]MDY8046595.1 hypothetical protein [Paenibacillus polymyxa]